MLKKLFKHEWKIVSRMMLAVHGLVVLIAVLSKIFMIIMGGSNIEGTTALLLMMVNIVIVASACVFTMVYSGFRFYKSVFTEQGYLTNTLPVTKNQIILAKGFVAVLWQIIDVVIVASALAFIVITKDNINVSIFTELLNAFVMPETAMAVWCTLIALVLSPIVTTLQLYFCVAVGNLFTGHKILGAIGAFAVTYTIREVIDLVSVMIIGVQEITQIGSAEMLQTQVLNVVDATLVITIVVTIVFSVLYYMGTKWIMDKKLNLQ